MSIDVGEDGVPAVTSLYDWETGCLCPALLSDTLISIAGSDLVTSSDAQPAVTRLKKGATAAELAQHMSYSKHYHEALFSRAPDYQRAIAAGKDARHLWFKLRDWRGDVPEGYFGELGEWAEQKLQKLEGAALYPVP